MTREAKLMSGIILIAVPSIQYGGYFLLTSLMNRSSGYMDNPLRQNFFRAGHAHAGVIVILALVCQVLADAALLPDSVTWLARIGVPLAAILIPLGFFLSMASPAATSRMAWCIHLCGSDRSGGVGIDVGYWPGARRIGRVMGHIVVLR